MQNDVLSEVPLGKRAHRENDALAAVSHYWVPSADPQEWFRIHCADDAQIRDHGEVSSVAVRAARYRQVQRSLMTRFLRKGPQENQVEVPLVQPNELVLLERQEKARTALLAWANQAGVQLDHDQLQQVIGISNSQEILGNGMRLVWGIKQPPSLDERQLIDRVKQMGDRLIVALSKYGQVVADLNAEGAKRICIGLKQNHGGDDLVPDQKEKLTMQWIRTWLEHQNALFKLQLEAAKQATHDRIHFFIEGFLRDGSSWAERKATLRGNPATWLQIFKNYTLGENMESSVPEWAFSRLAKFHQQGDWDALSKYLPASKGGDLYVLWVAAQDASLDDRVYGIDLLYEKENFVRACIQADKECESESDFDRRVSQLIANRFIQLHPYLISEIGLRIQPGEVGIVVLGGTHFRAGAHSESIQAYQGKLVEDCLEKSDKLRDMRFIVVDPHGYEDLCNESSRH